MDLTLIVDSSSNAHIFSKEVFKTENIEPIISNGVEAICGKYLIPKEIGTNIWFWTDDEGEQNTERIE